MSIMETNSDLVEMLVKNDTMDNGFRPDNVMQRGNPKNRAIISSLFV